MAKESRELSFSRPPILEATIEFRFADLINGPKLKKASDRLAGRYGSVRSEEKMEAKLDFAGRSAEFLPVTPSYRHTSDDQTDILTLTNSAVGWSRLAPYEGWQKFSERVVRELEIVEKAWGARKIQRLGMRYINRIDVPRSSDGLFHYEDYLAYKLVMGPLLDPQSGYQWLVRKDLLERQLVVIVQSAIVEPELPGTLAFTLDIDVSTELDISQRHGDILIKLEDMRMLKNEIFEAGLTPLSRKLFA